jgi:hypothetical protein
MSNRVQRMAKPLKIRTLISAGAVPDVEAGRGWASSKRQWNAGDNSESEKRSEG